MLYRACFQLNVMVTNVFLGMLPIEREWLRIHFGYSSNRTGGLEMLFWACFQLNVSGYVCFSGVRPAHVHFSGYSRQGRKQFISV
jgi:hypothetical protein